MSNRFLTGLLLVLGFALGIVLLVSDRSVSRLMEACGDKISSVLGF